MEQACRTAWLSTVRLVALQLHISKEPPQAWSSQLPADAEWARCRVDSCCSAWLADRLSASRSALTSPRRAHSSPSGRGGVEAALQPADWKACRSFVLPDRDQQSTE